MVLVLLVVPALIAAQHDVGRQIRAMQRGVNARARGLAWSLRMVWAVVLGWGAVTLGHVLFYGVLPAQILQALPSMADRTPMIAALGLFVAGTALLVLIAYVALGIAYQVGRRRAV
jgi:hypothetical protein